jgi:hypothetical protein
MVVENETVLCLHLSVQILEVPKGHSVLVVRTLVERAELENLDPVGLAYHS